MDAAIACLSSMATRRLLAELAGLHERQAGGVVVLTAMGGVDAARRVRDGVPADVVVLASGVMQALMQEGRLLPGTLRPVAISGIAVAVRDNAPALEIGTTASLRAAVLAAELIGYSTGPSGDHVLRMLRDWDVLPQVEARLRKAPPGVPVARLLADGGVTLGFQQLSELLGQPGITILGPLPPPIQAPTTFTAGVARVSSQPASARELIETFTGPGTPTIKRQYGMEPG